MRGVSPHSPQYPWAWFFEQRCIVRQLCSLRNLIIFGRWGWRETSMCIGCNKGTQVNATVDCLTTYGLERPTSQLCDYLWNRKSYGGLILGFNYATLNQISAFVMPAFFVTRLILTTFHGWHSAHEFYFKKLSESMYLAQQLWIMSHLSIMLIIARHYNCSKCCDNH